MASDTPRRPHAPAEPGAATPPSATTPPIARGKPRQAVIVIHGIGEQRPMDTLTGFVLGVLGTELGASGERLFYSKPDPNAGGFEQRRYRAFSADADSDFIEFYWQHLMPVAGWRFVLSWLWLLMRRPRGEVPARFAPLWWLCWLVTVALAAAALSGLVAPLLGLALPVPGAPKLTGIAAAALAALGLAVRGSVGDAAIYLNPHPRTVEARNRIRAAGVALLERLHADGRYDRIMVVGHSLGSVIGYDLLGFAWQRESEALRRRLEAVGPAADPTQPRLARAEAAAGAGDGAAWRQAVRDLHYEQRRIGARWLVTDLVTLGSPLAHASLLLARGADDWARRVARRELPVAPPLREDGAHFSYERRAPPQGRRRPRVRVVDHAAVFGVTVWTNLYFPARGWWRGDPIGGAVAPAFGWGVWDRAVTTRVRGGWLAHAHYWTRYPGLERDRDAAPSVLTDSLDLSRARLRPPSDIAASPSS
ncbi:hypothetical protein [Sphingomonas sp. BK235]|uniref:hypothetical protein n=1 Tax=Sphingomonas sp. BK235 TaxID=2512131 RepID=UPI0010518CFF|nr:hypothetical protein [Sphingomonas sp. BK235]TCP33674.1 hypothetical protein EV292_105123 [Sphingomonas sp. BK235]